LFSPACYSLLQQVGHSGQRLFSENGADMEWKRVRFEFFRTVTFEKIELPVSGRLRPAKNNPEPP
jgi:hypothetical protein